MSPWCGQVWTRAGGAGLVVLDLLVMGEGAHRGAAGAALLGPIGLWQDRAIGQHRQPGPVAQGEERGGARLGDIGACSHHADTSGPQIVARLDQRAASPVHAMVARHGNAVEPRHAQRSRALGTGHHGMPCLGQTRTARGKAGLKLAEGHVGGTQDFCGSGEAFVVMVAVQRDVAGGQQDLWSTHARSSKAERNIIGRSSRIGRKRGWRGTVTTCPAWRAGRDRPRRRRTRPRRLVHRRGSARSAGTGTGGG